VCEKTFSASFVPQPAENNTSKRKKVTMRKHFSPNPRLFLGTHDFLFGTHDFFLRTHDFFLGTHDFLFGPTTFYPRPTTFYPRPTTFYPRPTTFYPRPTAFYPRHSTHDPRLLASPDVMDHSPINQNFDLNKSRQNSIIA
jgi:hypothetical protein